MSKILTKEDKLNFKMNLSDCSTEILEYLLEMETIEARASNARAAIIRNILNRRKKNKTKIKLGNQNVIIN